MADEKDEKDERLESFRTVKRRAQPDPRMALFIKYLQLDMTMEEAGRRAGYSDAYIKKLTQRHRQEQHSEGEQIKEQMVRRMSDARAKAGIHTDSIVGSLVEIMQASPADILPEHPALQKAKANKVDHLIKKIVITPIKIGERTRKNKDGSVTGSPVIREKIELEMYSRMDAINQLRDNFGMKQEPRSNSFEETKRQEVERGIQDIMVAENCDQTKAAELLLANIGDAPHLIPVIQKYIKKSKKEVKEAIQSSGIN